MAKAKTPRNNKPNGASTHTPPKVDPPDVVQQSKAAKKADVRPNLVPINLEEEIRRRAYELWEQRGHESGHENEHWLMAETEVISRYHSQRQQSA